MKKILRSYETKGAFEIKDVNSEDRTVVMYLSKFGNIDSDNDIIRQGAFAKSIMEHGPNSTSNRKIAFLRYHDWEKPIGKFLELTEDSYGLRGVAQLGTSTLGEDAFKDYSEGIIREHSIGFRYVSDKIKWVEDLSYPLGGYYDITEVKLWEGSAVTFGANSETFVVDVAKTAQERMAEAQKISERLETVIKAIKNGQGTDERIMNLEMQAKMYQSQLVSLASAEPFVKEHSEANEPNTEKGIDWAQIISKL
jgi:HK97 family phage prohead protease